MTIGSVDLDRFEPVPARVASRAGWLRTAPWLTGRRAHGYLVLLALASMASLVVLAATGIGQSLSDPGRRPIAIDYAAFWGAGRLAIQHVPASAYDGTAIHAAELQGSRLPTGELYPFLYPPVFLLLCVPLALLPYLASLWAMVLATSALLVAGLRRIAPGQSGWLATLAFPGFLLNAGNGQASCLFAACFAGASIFLEKQPLIAGACLGGLVCKPHLAICVPIGLVAARRWTALWSCAATAACLLAVSWACFGTSTWSAFLASASGSAAALTDAQALGRMQSVFAAVLLLHGPTLGAMAIQAAASIASVVLLVSIVRTRPGPGPEISALVLAALTSTPYLFDYDLVCLAVPIAWWATRIADSGPLDWEKSALAGSFVLPLVARSVGIHLGVPLTPAIVFCLILLLRVRIRHDASSANGALSPRSAACLEALPA